MTEKEKIKRRRKEEDYYLKNQKRLARTEEEAESRYKCFESRDPFPKIESSLLNSADIFQYVAKTGMIFPFDCNKLVGASYEVGLKGTVIWWDEDGSKHEIELIDSETVFDLKPNSIAFVTLEPIFRIPDYMVLRFNLKISHVYKGLLLGTGPMVDPGFVGRLSIPLHNLTANTYTFKGGDGIIEMEVTKLSKNVSWLPNYKSKGLYKRKWIEPKRTLQYYIQRALEQNQDNIVRSSIPGEILKISEESDVIKNSLENVEKELKKYEDKIDKKVNQAGWFNIALVVAIVTIFTFACVQVYQLGTVNSVKKDQIYELEKKYDKLLQENAALRNELDNKISEFERQLNKEENKK